MIYEIKTITEISESEKAENTYYCEISKRELALRLLYLREIVNTITDSTLSKNVLRFKYRGVTHVVELKPCMNKVGNLNSLSWFDNIVNIISRERKGRIKRFFINHDYKVIFKTNGINFINRRKLSIA